MPQPLPDVVCMWQMSPVLKNEYTYPVRKTCMRIKITFYAQLRMLIDSKIIHQEVPEDASVKSVLWMVCGEFPDLKAAIVEDGAISDSLVIRKNGETIVSYDEALSDGDRLALTTQIVGG